MPRTVLVLAALAVVATACAGPEALGGPGAPAQRTGETYPGARAPLVGDVRGEDLGCLEAVVDGFSRFVIWPPGAQLDDGGIRLPGGALVEPGDRFEGIGAVTPIAPLVADPNGYWASVIGFCAPDADEALVLDEVGPAGD